MVGEQKILTRGGIYLAKPNPAKKNEVGKVRPIIILNSQVILNNTPPVVFVCPLSSQSQPEFKALHIILEPRDSLHVKSYALVEHCRSITVSRLIYPRLAQITDNEINIILHSFQRLIGL